MKKTTKAQGDAFNWETVSKAARSPETRRMLFLEYAKTEDLVASCTAVEDYLEFIKGKAARVERERIRDVRRIGEGV